MSITIVVGKNGSGKDMAAVEFGVLTCWRYGRAVWSNTSLYPEELGYSPGLYHPLNEPLAELPRLGRHTKVMCPECRARAHPDADACRRCGGVLVEVARRHPDGSLWSSTDNIGVGLLMSDITAMFPSRESLGLPPELAQTLQQLRKPDLAPVFITCPAWARVDLLLRECATTVIESYPWSPMGLFRTLPSVPWGWPSHRAFRRYFFDAQDYERADAEGALDQLEPMRHGRLLRRPARTTWKPSRVRRIQRAYDSFEDVELADHIACGECGGRLKKEYCKDAHGHREHGRAMRKQREEAAYPASMELAPPDLDQELVAALEAADDDDHREAEALERIS